MCSLPAAAQEDQTPQSVEQVLQSQVRQIHVSLGIQYVRSWGMFYTCSLHSDALPVSFA